MYQYPANPAFRADFVPFPPDFASVCRYIAVILPLDYSGVLFIVLAFSFQCSKTPARSTARYHTIYSKL